MKPVKVLNIQYSLLNIGYSEYPRRALTRFKENNKRYNKQKVLTEP